MLLSDCSGASSAAMSYFPVNSLRRAATGAAATDLIFYVDVDFLPSTGAALRIADFFRASSDSSRLLVLPCFWASPGTEWPRAPEASLRPEDDIPEVPIENLSKKRLLREIAAGLAASYNTASSARDETHSHGATNYPFWLAAAEDAAPYPADYTLWYEPYFALNTTRWRGAHGRGLFDDTFEYGLGDKAQVRQSGSAQVSPRSPG